MLHMLNRPIEEALRLVQLEEHEQVEVDFHPQCHNQKLELEGEEGTFTELGLHAKDSTPTKLGL